MQPVAVSPTAASSDASSRLSMDKMRSEDFFELLVTELQQQDPFEPTKTADMISQVSQIRTIEQSYELANVLERLTEQQRMAGTADLIGKFVEAEVAVGEGNSMRVGGVVTGVRYSADGLAMLELDTGEAIRAIDVKRIAPVSAAPQQAQPPADSGAEPDKSDNARLRAPNQTRPVLSLVG